MEAKISKSDEAVDLRAYIHGLSEPVSIDDLKPLIGQEFTVRIMTRSWGKDVVDTDKVVITNIQLAVDVESGQSAHHSAIMIFSDYYLDAQMKYNAWTGLKAFQRYVSSAD